MYKWIVRQAFGVVLGYLASTIKDVCSEKADFIDELGQEFVQKFYQFQAARTLHGCGQIPPPGQ